MNMEGKTGLIAKIGAVKAKFYVAVDEYFNGANTHAGYAAAKERVAGITNVGNFLLRELEKYENRYTLGKTASMLLTSFGIASAFQDNICLSLISIAAGEGLRHLNQEKYGGPMNLLFKDRTGLENSIGARPSQAITSN